MTTINPNALLGVALGVTGVMYATGKRPPDILLLATMAVSVVSLSIDLSNLFEPEMIEVTENDLEPITPAFMELPPFENLLFSDGVVV